jgi:arylsulfatase
MRMKAIILLLDTCRADHLSCYGHYRPTTPNIDKIASQGVRFTNAFASDTPCVPSTANKSTGQHGTRTGVVTHGEIGRRLRPGSDQMQKYFGRAGHRTCAISTVVGHAPYFWDGWEEFHRPNWNWHMQWIPAEEINDVALPWLRRNYDKDFLLFVHYWDPHTPYQWAPQDIFKKYYGDRDPAKGDGTIERFLENEWLREFFTQSIGPHVAIPPEVKDLEWLLAQYDAEITYADQQAGRLFDLLDELGIAEDTMLIVMADHGEQLGEWNTVCDHASVHDSCQRIPLIVRYPGRFKAGLVSDALVYNIDTVPTLLNEAGIEHFQKFDGLDLGPVCRGEVGELRDRLFLTHGLWTAQRAVRTKKWKYVKTYEKFFWDFPQQMLFDLEADPKETNDVFGQHPEVARELRVSMEEWIDDCLGGRTDPLRDVVAMGLPPLEWFRSLADEIGKPLPPALR